MSQFTRFAPWLWLTAGLIAYLLPWIVNPSIGLTFGGYDLAEWSSLHPSVRAAGLTTSLLLRLPPVLFVLMFALLAGNRRFSAEWWGVGIIVGLVAVASLPPLEFFTIFRDDPNYQQQTQLAVITLAGGIIALSGLLKRVIWPLLAVMGIVGAGVSGAGMTQGYRLMTDLHLPTTLGIGGFATAAAFSLLTALALSVMWRERKILS